MKLKNFILSLSILTFTGCATAQNPIPSPQPTTQLSWNCPGSSGCTVVLARAVCPTAATCPVNTGTSSPFVVLNPLGTSAVTFVDTAPPGGVTVIYTASILANGLTGQPSAPSNTLAIPTYPGTVSGLAGTNVAVLAPPVMPNTKAAPQLSKAIARLVGLQAKLIIDGR